MRLEKKLFLYFYAKLAIEVQYDSENKMYEMDIESIKIEDSFDNSISNVIHIFYMTVDFYFNNLPKRYECQVCLKTKVNKINLNRIVTELKKAVTFYVKKVKYDRIS